MSLPDFFYRELRAEGYNESQNLAEFWFHNRAKFSARLNRTNPTLCQELDDRIRWLSPVGQDAQQAVRTFIEAHEVKVQRLYSEACTRGHYAADAVSITERTLDLREFTFVSAGRPYTLDEFQHLYPNAKVYPHANLSGIDLSGIRLTKSVVHLVRLTYANLDDCNLHSVEFIGCTLNGASIRNARLQLITFREGQFTGADVSGSFLNVVQLDNRTVSSSLRFTQVSYWFLVWELLLTIMRQYRMLQRLETRRRHTKFLSNDTTGLSQPENRPFKSYVMWYQFVTRRIHQWNELSLRERVLFTASLVLTKAWNSYVVLASWGAITALLFAAYYHTHIEQFKNLDTTFLSALYFSVVTFTTLGYGDITPHPGFGQIIVIAEVIIGYLTLGSFAFLIGHKVADRF